MDDADYLRKFGTKEELSGLRRLIQERRATRPQRTYWVCKKCGWQAVFGPDVKEPTKCLSCNMAGYEDGGWMRRMTEKEIAKFKQDTAADDKRAIERAGNARFYESNKNRLAQGLKALTRAEFDAESRRAHQTMIEQQKRLSLR